MKTRLLLIRHGETDWVRERRYCGSNDVPLNAKGREQAARLGSRLRRMKIDSVYCSDLCRASRFAEIALKGRRIRRLAGLREMNFGIFEGKAHAELERKFPALYSSWLSEFGVVTPPSAEKFSVFRARVRKAFRGIIAGNRGKTCAVISHGGVIMVMLAEIVGREKVWNFLPALASLSIVELNGRQKKLVAFNL